jgi:hypothetical protein
MRSTFSTIALAFWTAEDISTESGDCPNTLAVQGPACGAALWRCMASPSAASPQSQPQLLIHLCQIIQAEVEKEGTRGGPAPPSHCLVYVLITDGAQSLRHLTSRSPPSHTILPHRLRHPADTVSTPSCAAPSRTRFVWCISNRHFQGHHPSTYTYCTNGHTYLGSPSV